LQGHLAFIFLFLWQELGRIFKQDNYSPMVAEDEEQLYEVREQFPFDERMLAEVRLRCFFCFSGSPEMLKKMASRARTRKFFHSQAQSRSFT
jgi:hypothetical protein